MHCRKYARTLAFVALCTIFVNSTSQKTRNIPGRKESDGSEETRNTIIKLIRVGLIEGYAVRKVKMFNDRIYLNRYRYYALDNNYYFETRDTCTYRMNSTERENLEYEDGEPILDVVYQCQRYAQYCCGLDCCECYPNFC